MRISKDNRNNIKKAIEEMTETNLLENKNHLILLESLLRDNQHTNCLSNLSELLDEIIDDELETEDLINLYGEVGYSFKDLVISNISDGYDKDEWVDAYDEAERELEEYLISLAKRAKRDFFEIRNIFEKYKANAEDFYRHSYNNVEDYHYILESENIEIDEERNLFNLRTQLVGLKVSLFPVELEQVKNLYNWKSENAFKELLQEKMLDDISIENLNYSLEAALTIAYEKINEDIDVAIEHIEREMKKEEE